MTKFGKLLFTVLIVVILAVVIFFLQKRSPVVTDDPPYTPEQALQEGILGNKDDLISFSILPWQKVGGVIDVIGKVKNGYFFEGNILINILDSNKKLLRAGHGTATVDWMTMDPVWFKTTVDLSGLPYGNGYIEIKNDNPSDLPENDKSIFVPIVIVNPIEMPIE